MASLSNSTIHDWLQYNGTDLALPSCQYVNYTGHLDYSKSGIAWIDSPPDISNASCSQVCNDSTSLFEPGTNNLVNCGLWSTYLSAYTEFDSDHALTLNHNPPPVSLYNQFKKVGLDLGLIEYALSYADTISSCLQLFYYNAKFFTHADDGTTTTACTREVLFPLGSNRNTSTPTTKALQECIQSICSPITLNPDLAGIGVSSMTILEQRNTEAVIGHVVVYDPIRHLHLSSHRSDNPGMVLHSEEKEAAYECSFSCRLGRLPQGPMFLL